MQLSYPLTQGLAQPHNANIYTPEASARLTELRAESMPAGSQQPAASSQPAGGGGNVMCLSIYVYIYNLPYSHISSSPLGSIRPFTTASQAMMMIYISGFAIRFYLFNELGS